MKSVSQTPVLIPEKVAYWYFRLNGFFQIENFVIHPKRRDGQRTDADLLAVRFPYRAERLIDDPNDVMSDDIGGLSLSNNLIDVVIAEVKTNQPCTLNGPWTRRDQQNVHRVLAAIGCLPREYIDDAAAGIYGAAVHIDKNFGLRIRVVAIGRDLSDELTKQHPKVLQLTWPDLLGFIWERFNIYRRVKTDVHQWDGQGQRIKRLANQAGDRDDFVKEALERMGVRNNSPIMTRNEIGIRECASH